MVQSNAAAAQYPEDEPLFSSAHAALTFAHHFVCQHYDPPAMVKMMRGPAIGSGKGLSGLDGAAQAGMVLAQMDSLPKLHHAILVARTAPPTVPCSCGARCCAKKRPNDEWERAIGYITQEAVGVLSGCLSHYRLRRAIVERCLGGKDAISKIAEECGVNRDTASNHNARILRWLRGDKPTKHAIQRVVDRKIGEEERAWAHMDELLRSVGLVG